MFLSPEDLQQLTGYKRPSKQCEWLLRNGFKVHVRADGRPAILLSQVEASQGSKKKHRAEEPNFAALE
jgi:hypothetical protein